jgi:hypothetical protein
MTDKKVYYSCIQYCNLASVGYLAFSSPSAPQGLFYYIRIQKMYLRELV